MTLAEARHIDTAADLEDPAARRWRLIRRWTTISYFLAMVLCIFLVGVPQGRESLLLWILAGLGTRCLGRTWRSFGRVLRDWLPFTGLLIAYDYTRGIADHLGFTVHILAPAHADLWLFSGTLPAYWLQQHLYIPADPRWYDGLFTLVYTSHFLVTPIVAVLLWMRNRPEWLRFIGRIIGLSLVGLTVYVLYPSAPPWYAAHEGVIQPVVRLSTRGFQVLGIPHAGTLLASGQAAANNVAAMPSLHTATATVVTLFFITRVPRWARPLLAAYPLVMGFVLIYTAEHYVVDVLFGYLTGILVTLAAIAVERWLIRRRLDAILSLPESVPTG